MWRKIVDQCGWGIGALLIGVGALLAIDYFDMPAHAQLGGPVWEWATGSASKTTPAVAQARFPDGATAAPGIAFQSNTAVGLFAASPGTMTLQSAGGGHLILSPGTGDIRWGKALVAVGGGAGATLGTIGGSGPQTATQNTWLRIQDSDGNAAWIPVWK